MAVLSVVGCALAAPSAHGHIQVHPTAVAPSDPVQFELLVPGERSARTVEVALKIPQGVLPFSFEDRPGWHRQLEQARDGSISVVRWHGDMRADAFVRFAFLAATPGREGDLVWKAVQRYSDGEDAAWIGAPGTEHPAAVTRVSATVPRQNAGGEGAGAAEPSGAAPTSAARTEGADSSDGDLALGLGFGGLALGAIALVVALRSRRPGAMRAER